MKMNREMFEGKDYPTQWALNPSMYQNIGNDQVDWAALAQQWIKMKETVVPPAPPPPSLNNNDSNDDDGGEAPMDMDTKDDDVPPAPPAPNISGNDNWNQWSQWGQWNTSAPGGGCWEWSGVPPPGVTIGPDGKPMGIPGMSAVPPAPNISNRSGFNVPPTASASPYTYNSVSSNQATFNQVPGYWTGDQSNAISAQGVPPFIKGMRHNSRMAQHMRNIDPMRSRDDKEKTPDDDTSMTIDAAKRRQLPAWIREGLEKMEREKHKAVERERQELLRRQEMEARKQAEDEARAVLDPAKSKFDSDSEKEVEQDSEDRVENDEDRQDPEDSPEIVVRPRRSRFRDADSPESRVINNERESPLTIPSITGTSVKRSREEVLQDVMLKVRRSLTEILLEVTNEEISSVCREVWSRYRAKAPAGEPPVASYTNTAPLAQITRKLGLGIYGDSNSESEEEQESQLMDDNDSDLELKETLRRRQSAFKKTEEEIEARLAKEEENEQRIEDHNSVKYENHLANDCSRPSVDEKEINNDGDESVTQSSGGHTPKRHIQVTDHIRTNQSTTSRSMDSLSNSSRSSTTSTSDSTTSDSSRNTKKRRKRKSKSRSRSRTRKSRSLSRSKDKRTHRKRFRSGSSSRKSGNKRSRERKRRSSRSSHSRSRSRRRSRSHSTRKSRERRRNTRSHSRNNRKRLSRSHSRCERRRSRSYGHSSSSKRRSSRSKERSRRSRSRNHRDGKKSAHRYRN